MPRVHIHAHDIDEIEELVESDWEQLSADAATTREARLSIDTRGHGVRRFGGADALDRKRADRRKSFSRPIKRS
jgi:hypothetical protein